MNALLTLEIARSFQILAVLLGAYLIACGVNALYELIRFGRSADRKSKTPDQKP